jgi:phosphoribosylaminoimidazole-succinocarboxamide synthase
MLTIEELESACETCLEQAELPELGDRIQGKVRDIYRASGDRFVLVTTDRVSAFDRVLGFIPYKGQVLNQLAAWWFEEVSDIVGSHVISVPDPNVTLANVADTLPVEVIVRAHITGVTDTSLWTLYQNGVDKPYGLNLPPGLQKNDKLPEPVITPTTKAPRGEHDERLTCAEVVERGLVEPKLWAHVQDVALRVFARGQEVAAKAGLLLVDTKYEFGLVDGKLVMIDEMHTPDSSRYWIADSWTPGGECKPENFDKEFLRKWFAAQGYRGEGERPEMPVSFRAQVAQRYISAYEKLTGETFRPGELPAVPRISAALETI